MGQLYACRRDIHAYTDTRADTYTQYVLTPTTHALTIIRIILLINIITDNIWLTEVIADKM